MSTSKPVALAFRSVTKTFEHKTGQRLLRDKISGALQTSGQQGRFTALDQISFDLRQGESLGLIGPNGAGKSTLLNVATGLSLPDSGEVEVHGRVAAMLELGAGFHPDLTGSENLTLYAAFQGMSRAETAAKFDSILDFAGIKDFADDPLRTYSSGMVVRLAFSVSAHTDPDVLLMDEVIGLGDQAFYERALEKIRGFQRQGKTIVLASHSVELLTMLCQRALWLDHGKIVQQGPAVDVAAAYQEGRAKVSSV